MTALARFIWTDLTWCQWWMFQQLHSMVQKTWHSHLVVRKPKCSEWSRGFLVKQYIRLWVGNCSPYIFRLTGIVCERAGSSHRAPSTPLSSAEWTNSQKVEFGRLTLAVTPPRNPTFSLLVGPSSLSSLLSLFHSLLFELLISLVPAKAT